MLCCVLNGPDEKRFIINTVRKKNHGPGMCANYIKGPSLFGTRNFGSLLLRGMIALESVFTIKIQTNMKERKRELAIRRKLR